RVAGARSPEYRDRPSLREPEVVRPGEVAQPPQALLAEAAGVGRAQSHAAPQVGVAVLGEPRDRVGHRLDVAAPVEQESAAHALVEQAKAGPRQLLGPLLLLHEAVD